MSNADDAQVKAIEALTAMLDAVKVPEPAVSLELFVGENGEVIGGRPIGEATTEEVMQ